MMDPAISPFMHPGMGHRSVPYLDPGGEIKESIWDTSDGFPDALASKETATASQVAAMHADIAAQHAAILAQHTAELAEWLKHLYSKCGVLQNKVSELEAWRDKTVKDVKFLREEHKMLKRQLKEEEKQLPSTSDARDEMEMIRSTLSPVSIPVPEITMPTVTAKIPESRSDLPPPPPDLPPPVPEEVPVAPPGLPAPPQGPVITSCEADATMGPQPDTTLQDDCSQAFQDELKEEATVEGIKTEYFGGGDDSSQPAMMKAEWRIGHLSTKLRGCMGRALVSSPFKAYEVDGLRLMLCPGAKEVAKGPRSRRQKEIYAKMVSDGPLEGFLKLKVPSCPPPYVMEYYLKVGSMRFGPFVDNFSECTVSPCYDLDVDWLKHVDTNDNSLTVGVEILEFIATG